MDQIEVSGLRISYQRAGDGPLLVLVHGYVGDSCGWRRQIDDLSDEFTVVAWDAPGYGGSSDPPSEFRLPERPADELVLALLPKLPSESAPDDVRREVAVNIAEFHPAGLRATARSIAEADLRDVLSRIDVPTLLLYGDQDVRAPLGVAQDLRSKIPGSRLVVIPGAGHMLHIEAADRFNSEVRAMLRSVSP